MRLRILKYKKAKNTITQPPRKICVKETVVFGLVRLWKESRRLERSVLPFGVWSGEEDSGTGMMSFVGAVRGVGVVSHC